MSETKKIKGARCTLEQYKLMIDYIENHRVMIKGKLSTSENKHVEKYWQALTVLLNDTRGANKTWIEWKRTFIEYKCNTKKNARDYAVSLRQTGGGTNETKPLTDVESKLLNLMGRVTTEGDPDLIEAGLDNQTAGIEPIDIANLEVILVNNTDNSIIDTYSEIAEMPITKEHGKESVLSKSISYKTKKQSAVSKKNRNVKKRVLNPVNRMEISANIYEENSKNLTNSMNELSKSIKALATSIENIAKAMIYFAKIHKNK